MDSTKQIIFLLIILILVVGSIGLYVNLDKNKSDEENDYIAEEYNPDSLEENEMILDIDENSELIDIENIEEILTNEDESSSDN